MENGDLSVVAHRFFLAQHAAKWGLTTGWQGGDWSRWAGGRSRKLSTSYHVVTVKMEPVQKFLAGQSSCRVVIFFFFLMGTDADSQTEDEG